MEDVEIERTDDEPQRAKYAIQVKRLYLEKELKFLKNIWVSTCSLKSKLHFDSICLFRVRSSLKDINKKKNN